MLGIHGQPKRRLSLILRVRIRLFGIWVFFHLFHFIWTEFLAHFHVRDGRNLQLFPSILHRYRLEDVRPCQRHPRISSRIQHEQVNNSG
jgi:hypothetical protein